MYYSMDVIKDGYPSFGAQVASEISYLGRGDIRG